MMQSSRKCVKLNYLPLFGTFGEFFEANNVLKKYMKKSNASQISINKINNATISVKTPNLVGTVNAIL